MNRPPSQRRPGQPEKESLERIRRSTRSPVLVQLRRRVARVAARALASQGEVVRSFGQLIGRGRIDGTSPRGNGDDEVVAVGILMQVGGELVGAAVDLLDDGRTYAGAALLRQIVEVEYLAWSFANQPGEARAWLNSTREQRLRMFQPRHLRQRSAARFNASDYATHCEMGGHHVPRAGTLVGRAAPEIVEVTVLDVLLHAWRIIDAVVAWADSDAALTEAIGPKLDRARGAFSIWSKRDPMYGLPSGPALAPG